MTVATRVRLTRRKTKSAWSAASRPAKEPATVGVGRTVRIKTA